MLIPRSTSLCRALTATVALTATFLTGAGRVRAQVDTGGLRGTIVASDGAPLAEVQLTLRHEPSRNIKQTTTNASGEFAFTGLRVGGPYSVTAELGGFVPQGLTNIYLSAGKSRRVSMTLALASEVIEITGTAGPQGMSQRAVFSGREIDELPSIGRDPKDVVRLMPEAYVAGDGQQMSIGGANSRFNSVTIDGIRQDDDFGLNGNGYPTQRSPIAMNAIEEISVERSPFDARYGSFLGGNVNIVTKSGGNEVRGAMLGALSNHHLTGSRAGKDRVDPEFRNVRYGVNLGGPIVRDRAHFFLSVEGLGATTPVSVGPEGSGAATEVAGVSSDDVARVRKIASSVYGFDAGAPGRSLDELDLKLMGKVDWALNRRHRLSSKYQRTAGNRIQDSPVSDMTLPMTSNWYDRRDTLHAYALQLFSDWSPRLSTELELSGKHVGTRQRPLSGSDFMTAEIATEGGGRIIIGPDEFRHANQLDNDLLHLKAESNYLWRSHLVTGGWEFDWLSMFNLFVPFSNGSAVYSSLDAFERRQPDSIFYANAVTGDPRDAAANWHYGVHTLFLQDQVDLTGTLTAQGGVRLELYRADTTVDENPNFVDRHGFSNTATLNGRSVIMPRLGLTYRPLAGLNLRGGIGLYSGGTPNVWVSNTYTNDGISIDSSYTEGAALRGFDGRDLPRAATADLVAGDGNVDALDPEFAIPSSWKVAAGADYVVDVPGIGAAGRQLGLEVNYVYSKVRRGLQWIDLRRDLESIEGNRHRGVLPDGRPYYDDGSGGFDPRRGYDMLLTNTDRGYSHTASVSLQKAFPVGLAAFAAYAWQNVKEVSPASSSRSVSNYGLAAVVDPNRPDLATSNYERAHRIIGSLRFSRPLIADLAGGGRWRDMTTTLALFMEARSGQPYSYTFGDSTGGDNLARLFGEDREFARRNRQQLYVPRGDGSDVVLEGIDRAEFDRFLARTGLDEYRGQIAPRNAFRGSWLNRIDLRFAQELPSAVTGQRARLFIDVENLGNLLNSEWGRVEQVPFPYLVPVVDVRFDEATEKYVYSKLRDSNPQRIDVLASVWRVQASLMYEF
jgi:hypothetical protein